MAFLSTFLLAARLLVAGGPFHGEEVGAKPLQGWWALSGSSRESVTWGPIKPSFKSVLDVIADDDAAKPTGVAIAVGLADPIFLARELGLTSPGRVPTQFIEAGGLDLGSPEPPQFPFKLAVTSPRAFTVEEQRAMNEAFPFDLHPRLSPPSALLMARRSDRSGRFSGLGRRPRSRRQAGFLFNPKPALQHPGPHPVPVIPR